MELTEKMGIAGLVLGVVGGGIAWWAFRQVDGGDSSYNRLLIIASIACLTGIVLVFLYIRKWWISD